MPNKNSRPGYARCGKMVYGDARKALKVALKVKSMLNVEYNIADTVVTATASPIAPAIVQLTNLIQGDGNTTRDGNQIKVTHIQLKYFFTMNASAVNTCCRILLVLDKQTNAAIYTANQLLKDVSVNDNVNSPFEENHRRRFTILYDRVHDLSDNGNQIGRGRKFIKLNIPVRYSANAGNIGDLPERSVSLVHMSTESTNTPLLNAFVRLLFVDN